MADPLDLALILASIASPVVVYDRDMCFAYANTAFCRSVHKPWEDLEGRRAGDVFPDAPERMELLRSRFNKVFETGESQSGTHAHHIPGPDGRMQERFWRSSEQPLFGADGTVTHVIQSGEDVTEEMKLRRAKDAVSAELEHRLRNTLTMVGSLAMLTGEHTPSVEAFVETFTDRLEAMSRNLSMISDNHWQGLAMREILEAELSQFVRVDDPRLRLEGPALALSVRTTKWTALMLHELTKNAVRHGCFSEPQGKLAVTWSVEGGALVLEWQETGRQGVAEPERAGFGTQLLGMMPNVTAQREFRDEGLYLKLTATTAVFTEEK